MKFITIGGVPAAGKTYTSKLLAKQNNFLALELETLRWDFFNNNSEENLATYTKGIEETAEAKLGLKESTTETKFETK